VTGSDRCPGRAQALHWLGQSEQHHFYGVDLRQRPAVRLSNMPAEERPSIFWESRVLFDVVVHRRSYGALLSLSMLVKETTLISQLQALLLEEWSVTFSPCLSSLCRHVIPRRLCCSTFLEMFSSDHNVSFDSRFRADVSINASRCITTIEMPNPIISPNKTNKSSLFYYYCFNNVWLCIADIVFS
jgi:hypothetical protein